MTETIQQESQPDIIDQLHSVLVDEDYDAARHLLADMHPSEIADAMEGLPGKARQAAWGLIAPEKKGDVLSELQVAVRTELLEQMQPHEVAYATRDLDTDDVADIIQELPEATRDTVLLAMDVQKRQHLASVLSYPEDTAGGLMNIDVISVRADVTLDVVTRYLRQLGSIPEQTDDLMVVDRENNYLGVLSLADVLIKPPESTVGEFMTDKTPIPANADEADVAKMFEQRDLFSAAVVNDENKLLGRITVDDVLDVIQEEAEHTVRSMAGLGYDDMFAPVVTSARRRAIWLGINLVTAFLAAWVIGQFEDTIKQLVALAVLMPIVAGMGGIAGSQTLTIAIRGLALGQIGRSNARALLLKELLVGLLNGLVWSLVVALIVILWFGAWPLGVIIGLAMIVNLIVAALAGALIPLLLKRMGVDPAIAGGVLLTTVTDVVGFVTFLGLATLFLLS
ncbi:MAG TPA: magnesium transporter [Gammaproteobacteria bacterium]|nr:magnesium transporter [Gammaproteobacteria bacterium]